MDHFKIKIQLFETESSFPIKDGSIAIFPYLTGP